MIVESIAMPLEFSKVPPGQWCFGNFDGQNAFAISAVDAGGWQAAFVFSGNDDQPDRIESLGEGKPKSFQEQLMGRLFAASEALNEIASTKRAMSIEGALFQLSLAYDCVQNLDMNEHSQQDEGEILHRVKCLLFSARCVMRVLAERDTAERYMPEDHDPLIVFDRAMRI